MALTIVQIITLRAPQYTSDPRLTDMIELAKMLTSSNFGDRYNLAVALRVLHTLTLETIHGGMISQSTSGSAIAGVITSEAEGDLSRAYANPASSTSAGGASRYVSLQGTAYGLELIELINSSFVLPRTRMMV